MNIGEVIRKNRQKRNMTQAQLAALLNVTPQAVSRWEMGISYPDIAMVPKISEILWASADELLGIRPWRFSDNEQSGGEESQEHQEPVLSQSQVDSLFGYVPGLPTGEHRRILVADDSDFMRMMLEKTLTRCGHIVLQARNGQECLNVLQSETVDVCVLDIVMPVMDGIAALRRIKEEHPQVKTVMLSALARESYIRQALELGADAYVVKPFAEECLIERIE